MSESWHNDEFKTQQRRANFSQGLVHSCETSYGNNLLIANYLPLSFKCQYSLRGVCYFAYSLSISVYRECLKPSKPFDSYRKEHIHKTWSQPLIHCLNLTQTRCSHLHHLLRDLSAIDDMHRAVLQWHKVFWGNWFQLLESM